jgi:hypothetical protein
MLGNLLCPADRRIQAFLDDYLKDVCPKARRRFPATPSAGPAEGLARVMSLPLSGDTFHRPICVLPSAAGNSAQSEERPPHHAGNFSHRRRRIAGSGRQIAVPKKTFAALLAAALNPPADLLALPFTAISRSRCAVSSAAAAAAGLPGHGRDPGQRAWRSASSRPAAWSAISISWKAFSATRAIRIFRKTTPRSTSALDRAHRLRDPGAASGGHQEEGCRAAARRKKPPSASAATACAGAIPRNLQRRRLVQSRLPRRARRDGHHHRRQLLRLLQERSEDADQLRRELLRLCEEEHAGGAIAFATYVLGRIFYAGRTRAD